jgi:hypothetical protein
MFFWLLGFSANNNRHLLTLLDVFNTYPDPINFNTFRAQQEI